MDRSRTNPGSRTLLALLALTLTAVAAGLGSCAPAPRPGAPGASQAEDGAIDESQAVDRILQPRTLSEYWWNLPEDQIPRIQGGSYLAQLDSLGFEEYRALPEEDQRERRRQARDHVKKGDELGRNRKAVDQYATAVGLCPYLTEAWLYYSEGVINLGNYNSGRYLLLGVERTLRFAGSENDQRKTAAEFYLLDAVASFNLQESERALESVSNSLTLKPNDAEAMLLRARCLVELQRFDEAREELQHFEFGSPDYARAQAVLGVLEMEAGDYGRAERAFNEAYEYGLRSGIMENDRGRLRLLQDEPESAARHFERAVDLRPDLMEPRNNLAVALRRQGKDQKAEEVLRTALRINPDYAPAHFNLAEILRDRMDQVPSEARGAAGREALLHYDQALERGYRAATVLEHRAYVHLLLGDPEAAEQDLQRLAGEENTDGRVLFLLARSKKEQGEYRIAEQLYRMALEREYREAEVYSDLGEVLMREGDLLDARLQLEQAIARDPDLVVTRVNLSEVLRQLGETAEALRVLDEAEALAPGDPAVAAQREALKNP